ncbi:MAG: hypothetical protein AAGJ35_15255, partial [Myxococcota bacterium]
AYARAHEVPSNEHQAQAPQRPWLPNNSDVLERAPASIEDNAYPAPSAPNLIDFTDFKPPETASQFSQQHAPPPLTHSPLVEAFQSSASLISVGPPPSLLQKLLSVLIFLAVAGGFFATLLFYILPSYQQALPQIPTPQISAKPYPMASQMSFKDQKLVFDHLPQATCRRSHPTDHCLQAFSFSIHSSFYQMSSLTQPQKKFLGINNAICLCKPQGVPIALQVYSPKTGQLSLKAPKENLQFVSFPTKNMQVIFDFRKHQIRPFQGQITP